MMNIVHGRKAAIFGIWTLAGSTPAYIAKTTEVVENLQKRRSRRLSKDGTITAYRNGNIPIIAHKW